MVSSNMPLDRFPFRSGQAAVAALLAVLSLVSSADLTAQGRQQATRPAPTPPPVSTPPVTAPLRTPLMGTLGPDAARALAGQSSSAPDGDLRPDRRRLTRLGTLGDAYIPLLVQDAPMYNHGGTTLSVRTVSPEAATAPAFYPTMQKPVWRVVPEEHPVQAWRLVDVDDVVCDARGECFAVTTRMLARWAPALRSYAFRDRVGRIWLVQ